MRYQAALRPDLGGRTESPPPGLAGRIRGNDVSDGVFPRSAAACPASDILRNLCKLIGDGAPALFKAHFLMLLHGRFVPMPGRSEEHTSELQSLMRNSYAVFCLKKKIKKAKINAKQRPQKNKTQRN